jgi:hypothetical protein
MPLGDLFLYGDWNASSKLAAQDAIAMAPSPKLVGTKAQQKAQVAQQQDALSAGSKIADDLSNYAETGATVSKIVQKGAVIAGGVAVTVATGGAAGGFAAAAITSGGLDYAGNIAEQTSQSGKLNAQTLTDAKNQSLAELGLVSSVVRSVGGDKGAQIADSIDTASSKIKTLDSTIQAAAPALQDAYNQAKAGDISGASKSLQSGLGSAADAAQAGGETKLASKLKTAQSAVNTTDNAITDAAPALQDAYNQAKAGDISGASKSLQSGLGSAADATEAGGATEISAKLKAAQSTIKAATKQGEALIRQGENALAVLMDAGPDAEDLAGEIKDAATKLQSAIASKNQGDITAQAQAMTDLIDKSRKFGSKTKDKVKAEVGTRCLGITKKKKECSFYTHNPNGYCEMHQSQAPA